ncbi:MAG TPA: ATP-binding protein [Longimicrobium sp.]|nr:ATP-binding protein [Longimicrobium sp.]
MTRVVAVPPTLDSDAFDALVAEANAAGDERLLFDARHVRFADPYGMTGLLALGVHFTRDGVPPILQFPQAAEVASYFTRMGFVAAAEGVFEMHDAPRSRAGESSVLLPITVVGSPDDVHGVIEELNEHRISKLFSDQLGYSPADAMAFSMLLSEVSQNIVEHADAPGWVGIQTYKRWRRVDKRVVVIAVIDLGVGFRGSLEREHAGRFGDRWGDATALEAAFIHGVTRFRDPGRGQGLKQIRRRVGRWGGKIAIRSGTARISDVPEWDDGEPMTTELAPFPGAQILIVLPARTPAPPPEPPPTRPGARSGNVRR